jgi:tRNA(Ile)-lysidine synthase
MPPVDRQIALRKRIEQRVRRFMLDRELWPVEGKLLVAVSGGPDSTALLLILARLARVSRVPLHTAYCDHGLRPPEAIARERAFLEKLCDSLNIPFTSGSVDVSARRRRDHLSTEDAARRERYAFLARTAAEVGASFVATGHTASDQAETVLLRLIRGSGVHGLAGIGAKSRWPDPAAAPFILVRPLLRVTRLETQAYCAAADVEPLADETNASSEFTRNRVRNELMPLLESFNPRVEEALVRLAENARTEGEINAVREAVLLASPGGLDFGAAHVEAIRRLVAEGQTGDSLALPSRLRARRTRDSVVLEPVVPRQPLPPEVVPLSANEERWFGHLLVLAGKDALVGASNAVEVDAAALDGLRVRRRRNGDRMQPAGMQGTKKLQDLFVDAHVDRDDRDRTPIFESDRGIVWVGGLRLAEWAKPLAGRPIVWLSYREQQ